MSLNYFVHYPKNFDIHLKTILENLDVEGFNNYIREGGDISAINLSLIICQIGDADEEILWNVSRSVDDLSLFRDIDRRKATLVTTLLKMGIPFDEKCLLYCYTFRCPKTAEILLSYGINPNINCGVSTSLLAYIDDGRYFRGFNYSSAILISEFVEIIKDYGGL